MKIEAKLRFHVGEIKKGYILKHIKRELKFELHKNHSKCGVQEDKRGTYHTSKRNRGSF